MIRHGIDVIEIDGFLPKSGVEATAFTQRCFTSSEVAAVGEGPHRAERLAARFAAKEAALKALGTGWQEGIAFTDIEVLADEQGAPTMTVTGRARHVADALGITQWVLSIAHTRSVAVASVIALTD